MNSGWRRGVRRVLVGAAITSAVHCSASNPSATKTGDGGSTPADAGGGGEAGGGSGGACSGFSDDAGIIVCPTFGSLTPAQVSGEQSFCSSGGGTWVATCPSPAGTLGGVCTLGIAGNLISSVTYYSGGEVADSTCTGSGGTWTTANATACNAPYASGCDMCLATHCCQFVMDCYDNPTCTKFIQCFNTCFAMGTSGATCESTCGGQDYTAETGSLEMCAESSCATECL